MTKTPHPKNFEKAYHKFALPLMKFLIKRMGGNDEAVEEVFSQTIISAWKGFHTFQHKSTYFTWLCKIALHKMADYYKDQINQKSTFIAPGLEILAKMEDNSLLPEEKLALDELRYSVRQCLLLLPEEKRRLLYLRYWQELSIRKIADILGVSERSAEGKLYRAKLAFRQNYLVLSTKKSAI